MLTGYAAQWPVLAALIGGGVFGCHELIPNVECTRTADCQKERVCFDGRCLVSCSDHDDCRPTELCELGVCSPLDGRSRPGDAPGGGDNRDDDGGGDDRNPGDSRAGDETATGDAATSGDANPGGAPIGGSCVDTPDCAPGLKCENQRCCSISSDTCCGDVADCPGDNGCVSCDDVTASCLLEPEFTECDTCGDCDSSGSCIYDETQDYDCHIGEPECGECASLGQCTFHDGVGCGAGRSCSNGRCINPDCVMVAGGWPLRCNQSAADEYCAVCSPGTPTFTCSADSEERAQCFMFFSCGSCQGISCCSSACVTSITCD